MRHLQEACGLLSSWFEGTFKKSHGIHGKVTDAVLKARNLGKDTRTPSSLHAHPPGEAGYFCCALLNHTADFDYNLRVYALTPSNRSHGELQSTHSKSCTVQTASISLSQHLLRYT